LGVPKAAERALQAETGFLKSETSNLPPLSVLSGDKIFVSIEMLPRRLPCGAVGPALLGPEEAGGGQLGADEKQPVLYQAAAAIPKGLSAAKMLLIRYI